MTLCCEWGCWPIGVTLGLRPPTSHAFLTLFASEAGKKSEKYIFFGGLRPPQPPLSGFKVTCCWPSRAPPLSGFKVTCCWPSRAPPLSGFKVTWLLALSRSPADGRGTAPDHPLQSDGTYQVMCSGQQMRRGSSASAGGLAVSAARRIPSWA